MTQLNIKPSSGLKTAFCMCTLSGDQYVIAWLLLHIIFAGCAELDQITVDQSIPGPQVQYLPYEKPYPLTPFPSDHGTRYEPRSSTQRQLNISTNDPTTHGSRTRQQLNQLDGFGLFSPITVSFEGQLDLATVTPDRVQLIELGEVPASLPLDLGDGFFPLDSSMGWMMGKAPDPLPPNFLFPWDNQVDALQWRTEDDRQAAFNRYQRGDNAHLTHYEVESNTLIIRPLKPLRPHQTYAVLLSSDLSGWNASGEYGPLRSPFRGFSARSEQAKLKPVRSWYRKRYQGDIAFAWTFTTGQPRRMLDAVRQGLYGLGDLADIELLPRLSEVRAPDVSGDEDQANWHSRLLSAQYLEKLSQLVGTVTGNSGYAIDFPDVDYFVLGSFQSRSLRGDQREWIITPNTQGKLILNQPAGELSIPFMISIPKSSIRGTPPFPVVIYFHGTSSSRVEGLILAQELAKQGIALLSFDQVGHGPLIRNFATFDVDNASYGPIVQLIPLLIARLLAPELESQIQDLSFADALEQLSDIGLFQELAVIGRWEDVNGDGRQAAAEGFFDHEPEKLCSSFWQDLTDGMMAVKLLRSFNPQRVPPRRGRPSSLSEDALLEHLLAGDFNADGILDLGGPLAQISAAGTSLGGIHALLLAAIEPEIDVVTPIVPGAGMVDILSRTNLRFVARPLFESYLGQAVVGCSQHDFAHPADSSASLYLSFGDASDRCNPEQLRESAFHQLQGDWRGASVELINHRSTETTRTTIDDSASFTIHLESNYEDPMTLTITPPIGSMLTPFKHVFNAQVDGSGYQLYTPKFRRAAFVLNHLLERCDPITFADSYSANPSIPSKPVKTLVSIALGDRTVPVNTAISLANALGLLGSEQEQWFPRLTALRDQGVLLGVPPALINDPLQESTDPLFDVDRLLDRDESPSDALGPFPPISVGDGLSAVRFAHVEGDHEWIAGYQRDGFNYSLHTLRQIAAYHRCSGRLILDEAPYCLQSEECPIMDQLYLHEACQYDQTFMDHRDYYE